jgi:hypothetical protein
MAKNTEYKEEIKKKFLCQDKFAQEIETMVQSDPEQTYISAIVDYCEVNNIEVENISKLITKPLKEKLKYEAIELNFIKRTSKAKLPF